MAEGYNPIVRVFGRLRSALSAATGVPRREIRPGTELEALLPRDRRRELWREVRRQGVKLPPLELPRWPARVSFTAVMVTPVGVAVVLGHWIGLCSVVPLCALSFLVSRPWCVAFPIGLRTVGELGLCLTSYAEHRGSGYRWTRNEVAMKVRMIVAGSLALRLDEVRPETTWAELLGAD